MGCVFCTLLACGALAVANAACGRNWNSCKVLCAVCVVPSHNEKNQALCQTPIDCS